ncbi:hypothetical protein AL486_04475 [Pandoraea apista]|uniref:cysteine-rich CWC family protein n=1 Tax=Pandoraea apista TaxID=93218 RepID=UPI000CE93A72|nr:cysteine-rich CWC family protein [Pandoraea apista]AVF39056.1 hypothetical protein AL486_04475 [Pandoraea apista]
MATLRHVPDGNRKSGDFRPLSGTQSRVRITPFTYSWTPFSGRFLPHRRSPPDFGASTARLWPANDSVRAVAVAQLAVAGVPAEHWHRRGAVSHDVVSMTDPNPTKPAGVAPDPDPDPDPSRCPKCGAVVTCGAQACADNAGDIRCWCLDWPRLPASARLGAGSCLCPDCLRAALAGAGVAIDGTAADPR